MPKTAAQRGDFVPKALFNNYRAQKRNLPANLSGADWARAVAYFESGCAYCGTSLPPAYLTVDHIVPLSDPDCPGNVAANVIPACFDCNQDKGHRALAEWLVERFGVDRAAQILDRVQAYQQAAAQEDTR